MISLENGSLVLDHGFAGNSVTLCAWLDGTWIPLPLWGGAGIYAVEERGVRAEIRFDEDEDSTAWSLRFSSERPTRLQLALNISGARDPFHIIPANIFGDNNLARAEPGHYPHLTTEGCDGVSCSPYREFRADRAAAPVSILCFEGGAAAVSIVPYFDCPPENTTSREGFVRNGLFAQRGHESCPDACGVTIGYRNTPSSFINKDQWGVPTEHCSIHGESSGRIFLRPASSRLAAHDIVRAVCEDVYEEPTSPLAPRDAAEALLDAFLTVNWQPDAENFSNMHTHDDPERKRLRAWRTLAEIGWTGGGAIAYPLLAAGRLFGDDTAVARAVDKLDWVADARNSASGFLWEVHGKTEGTRIDYWWSGYIVSGVHCAYTNGSAVYYLLKSHAFEAERGHDHPEWLDAACGVLDTVVDLQTAEGSFGYTYSTERPEIVDHEGFVGVHFVPALVMAHRLRKERGYLDAARRAMEFYHPFVRNCSCWGAPMDTWKSVDQEGNLAFIRAAYELLRETGEEAYLRMLEDGAHYEYLWRYCYRARPEFPPLKGSAWTSCGGSVTSVSNPHIHPMGVYISRELGLLADRTGDPHHLRRCLDGLVWGANCISLYPETSGYGAPGVLTERFCPSDGLAVETFPDGTPSSMWFSYNGWAAAAVLEGLVESIMDERV